jgi:hypothetical protein
MTALSINALYLLLSTFALVFCLGLQSQFVNNGHYISAFTNSLAIGTANLVLFKLAPNATPIESIAYISGGPIGIVCSMLFYRWHYPTRAAAFHNGFIQTTTRATP